MTEELKRPVIIMHTQLHEKMGICKLDTIGRIMVMAAEKSSVPICVHLDHGTDLAYIKSALDLGFTSVMYDGSALPFDINSANTRIAVSQAARLQFIRARAFPFRPASSTNSGANKERAKSLLAKFQR